MIYREIPIATVREPDWSWHHVDEVLAHKLDGSLATHGQLRAVVVRQVDEGLEIVEGRALFRALQRAGHQTVTVADVGTISREAAVLMALSLELRHEVDYVKLGREVAALAATLGAGVSSITPFTGVDIGYYTILSAGFDWSQFHEEDRQEGFFDTPDTVETYEPETQPDGFSAPINDQGTGPDTPPPPAPIVALRPFRAAQATRPRIPEAPTPGAAVAVVTGDPWDTPPIPQAPCGGVQFFGAERPVSTWTPTEPRPLDGIPDLVLNVETDGLRWYAGDRPVGITVGSTDGQFKQFLPFRFTGGNLDEGMVKEWALRELRGKRITNANTRFDVHMMRAWGVDLEEQGCTFSDVMHYAALLDEYRKQFGLDALVTDFLKVEGPPRVDESRMPTYHAGDVAARAEFQVDAVARLREVMWPLLDKEDLQKVRQLEDDVIPVVCEMEKNAAHVDRGLLKGMVERSAETLNACLWEVAKDLGVSMNPDKNEDWQRLFKHYDIPITTFTEKGTPSFTDELLKTIDHPKVQLARRAGKIASIRSKFLLAYDEVVGDDSKLRFSLHQLRGDEYGTVRGRFSMSGGGRGEKRFGANLQQVMRVNSQREAFGFRHDDDSHDEEIYLVRSLFVPEQGSYLSADAQAIEYRLAAHFADSAQLIKAYEKDTAQLNEGRLTDKWVDFHGVVGDIIRPHKDLSRNIVKNANFCLVYGGGDETATRTMGVTPTEGSQIVGVWRRMFPEFKALHRRASSLAETRGYVKTILGRRARFPDKTWCHAALNYVVQGSAADVMKVKLVELHKARKDTGLVMRQTVHDEVDGDALAPDTEQKVRVILNRQSFPSLKVPIVWQVSTGRNWADTK